MQNNTYEFYGSAVTGTGPAAHPVASQQVLPGGLPTQHYRSTGSVSEPRGRQAPRPHPAKEREFVHWRPVRRNSLAGCEDESGR